MSQVAGTLSHLPVPRPTHLFYCGPAAPALLTPYLCGCPQPWEALRAGWWGGPVPVADCLQAEQPVAVVLIAGTHHTDGVDETAWCMDAVRGPGRQGAPCKALVQSWVPTRGPQPLSQAWLSPTFNQERADLLLPLFQVDVDGAERELPLQGVSGTGPDPPPRRALPSWVGKWTPGRGQSRAEANTLREARQILSVLEGCLHTGSRWGFLQPMSDSGLVGDWSPGPPTKMGVGGKGSRGSPLCFSMTEGQDHPQSRRYPDAQDGPSRHAYTHARTHTQASGTRKMPAQRYRPSRSTVGPMPPPGDWPAGGCGLASMIQGAEARCPPSLPTSG